MQFVGKQHGAWIGRPPEQRLAVLVPGEAAMPVGLDQPARVEVPAGREQAVGLVQGLFQGRELEIAAG
ncbi:hypothetical protein D3C78_1913080 [compost metagenome]